jgi:hypothetical protein
MATVVGKRRRRTRKLTEAEFMRLPDDGRKYELVDGEAKEVPTSFLHGVLGMRVAMLLQTYLTTPSVRFPLRAGGTAPARFPSRSGGNLKEGSEKPKAYLYQLIRGTCCNWCSIGCSALCGCLTLGAGIIIGRLLPPPLGELIGGGAAFGVCVGYCGRILGC